MQCNGQPARDEGGLGRQVRRQGSGNYGRSATSSSWGCARQLHRAGNKNGQWSLQLKDRSGRQVALSLSNTLTLTQTCPIHVARHEGGRGARASGCTPYSPLPQLVKNHSQLCPHRVKVRPRHAPARLQQGSSRQERETKIQQSASPPPPASSLQAPHSVCTGRSAASSSSNVTGPNSIPADVKTSRRHQGGLTALLRPRYAPSLPQVATCTPYTLCAVAKAGLGAVRCACHARPGHGHGTALPNPGPPSVWLANYFHSRTALAAGKAWGALPVRVS